MSDQRDLDPNLLKMYSFLVFSKLEGAVTSGMIHLGDRLGLYQNLSSFAHPVTSDELAASLQLHPRWVQEWIHNQAAARLLEVSIDEQGTETYSMTPEAIVVLADELHPAFGMGMFHRLPQTMAGLTALPESFRTGIGLDYDSHGPEGAVGIERSFEPWSRSYLLPVVLPALDGAVSRLESGAQVADIGCGAEALLFAWRKHSQKAQSPDMTFRVTRSTVHLKRNQLMRRQMCILLIREFHLYLVTNP